MLGNYCLTSEQIRNVFANINSLKLKCPVNINDPLQILLLDNAVSAPKNTYAICGGCLAGYLNFAISCDGSIKPCTRLPINLGSILTDEWETILSSEISKTLLLRKFEGKCKSCNLVLKCGGCRAEAYAQSNNPFGEDPGCWKEAS